MACLDILDKQEKEEGSRDLALVRRALFSSVFSAAAEERGSMIELLQERLEEKELLTILNYKDPQGRTALMNAAIHNRGRQHQEAGRSWRLSSIFPIGAVKPLFTTLLDGGTETRTRRFWLR